MTRLYLRLWLAIAAAVIVVSALVAGGVRWYYEQNVERQLQERLAIQQSFPPPPREISIKDDTGKLLASGPVQGTRIPGAGQEFPVTLENGQRLRVIVGPRARASGAGDNPGAARDPRYNRSPMAGKDLAELREGPQFRGPPPDSPRRFGMAPPSPGPGGALLVLVSLVLAVALGAYPVVRKLTKRLEALKSGVQRFGEGDLAVRVPVTGKDEIAFLSAQFNETAQRIDALVSSHKTLLANASHELRSPLARLRMGLELSEHAPSPALQAEMARSIQELDALIEEILLASRLNASPANAGGAKLEALDFVGLLAEECAAMDAELNVIGVATTKPSLQGDARLLRRLVRNLLENARRYGTANEHTGQAVTVLWNGTTLQVCDHGPGIPLAERERIFEPFYRLPGASEANGGVGLGLALVKSIANHHRASVWCEDRSDGAHGACFKVCFETI